MDYKPYCDIIGLTGPEFRNIQNIYKLKLVCRMIIPQLNKNVKCSLQKVFLGQKNDEAAPEEPTVEMGRQMVSKIIKE